MRASHDRERRCDALDNYSLGIALVFLTEVHPAEHTGEINILLEELLRRQKPQRRLGLCAIRDTG